MESAAMFLGCCSGRANIRFANVQRKAKRERSGRKETLFVKRRSVGPESNSTNGRLFIDVYRRVVNGDPARRGVRSINI